MEKLGSTWALCVDTSKHGVTSNVPDQLASVGGILLLHAHDEDKLIEGFVFALPLPATPDMTEVFNKIARGVPPRLCDARKLGMPSGMHEFAAAFAEWRSECEKVGQ